MSRAVERWKESRAGRTVAWYGARNAALLCGGIAYAALFSLFAGLTIGWSVFSASLGRNDDLRDAVLEQVDTWMPGLVGEGPDDLINPDQLVLPSAWTWASVVAAVVLLFSALRVMAALRSSVRSMFDLPATGQNLVLVRVWQLAGFALLGVAVLASAGASVAAGAVGQVVESWLGGSELVAWAVRLGAAVVGIVLDAAVVVMIVTVVAGARPRRRDLIWGSLAAGAVAGALRWLGTTIVVGSAGANRLLAPFAAIITILVLINVVARILLLVCAWMYDPPRLEEAEEG
ncbi:ribonuclease BN [Xylanimonas cellulosilytica DSM 15894]|uniref:Ribonuclease BN n=1 Tax=Xylanimonas cellulosilytica (strain DSM 15894 / JCM 12276 / CECT 5975 / KCTC 9989 / LMG 20990 / NBRC 107835 / XIL07) TaxID=446471 RepID=D1BYU2_XYLCX|nr:ribonuclease BN [Xylanimonas cellulosilytica DSM 15894]